jgi:hypothetical protein
VDRVTRELGKWLSELVVRAGDRRRADRRHDAPAPADDAEERRRAERRAAARRGSEGRASGDGPALRDRP